MTPEEEEQVARILAETARHEPVAPLPVDVSARLDDVLADLTAARVAAGTRTHPAAVGSSGPGGIDGDRGRRQDELAAHRRRRRGRELLTAAAAVVVIGAAGVAVATGGGSSPDPDQTTAGGDASVSAGAPEADAPTSGSPGAAPGPSLSGRKPASEPSAAAGSRASDGAPPRPAAVPRLRTSSLASDVQRAVDSERLTAVRRRAPTSEADGCVAPTPRGGGRVIDVLLDGRPATLLVKAPDDGRQAAEVYSCRDAGDPVASTTVRAR